jgi:hypothetical protein
MPELDPILYAELKKANQCYADSDSWYYYEDEEGDAYYAELQSDDIRLRLGELGSDLNEAQIRVRVEKAILQIIQQRLTTIPATTPCSKTR